MENKRKIAGLILAAGLSERFGSNKQLATWQTNSLINHCIEQAVKSKLDSLFIILGNNASLIYKQIQIQKVNIIFNPFYKQGINTSIRNGINVIEKSFDAVMILLSDMPNVDSGLINQLITFSNSAPGKIVFPIAKNVQRNPVIFPDSIFRELSGLPDGKGAKTIIHKYPNCGLEISDERSFLDIDTPNDYHQLKNTKV